MKEIWRDGNIKWLIVLSWSVNAKFFSLHVKVQRQWSNKLKIKSVHRFSKHECKNCRKHVYWQHGSAKLVSFIRFILKIWKKKWFWNLLSEVELIKLTWETKFAVLIIYRTWGWMTTLKIKSISQKEGRNE